MVKVKKELIDYNDLNRLNVGRRITLARVKQGLTQKGLAGITNKKQTEIALYENGKRLPKDDMLELLANRLDVDAEWLRYGDKGEYVIERDDTLVDLHYSHVSADKLSKAEMSKAKKQLNELTDEDKTLVYRIIEALYLDEHRDELSEKVAFEKEDFEKQRAEALSNGESNGKYRVIIKNFSPEEFLYSLGQLYPDLYEKYSYIHGNYLDLLNECLNRLHTDEPELIKEFDEYIKDHTQDENKKYLQDHLMVQAIKNAKKR